MNRTTNDFEDHLLFGKELPELVETELELPLGVEVVGEDAAVVRRGLHKAEAEVCRAFGHYPKCICGEVKQ